MTTVAPIDVDASTEAAVLIDYENIRLSWEREFDRLFYYSDLAWLCEAAGRRFRTSIARIVVFMSDPEDCKDVCGTPQLEEIRRTYNLLKDDERRCSSGFSVGTSGTFGTFGISGTSGASSTSGAVVPTAHKSSNSTATSGHNSDESGFKAAPRVAGLSAVGLSETRGKNIDNSNDSDTGDISSITNSGEEDGSDSDISDVTDDDDNEIDILGVAYVGTGPSSMGPAGSADPIQWVNTTQNKGQKLYSWNNNGFVASTVPSAGETGQPNGRSSLKPPVRLGIDPCPGAQVFVKAFKYKKWKRQRVQRGCDVVIGSEVTKICFLPRFTSIILFSADSDFEETTKACAESEVIDGVMKYAKPIRIVGFGRAFEHQTRNLARDNFKMRTLRRQQRFERTYLHRLSEERKRARRCPGGNATLSSSSPLSQKSISGYQNGNGSGNYDDDDDDDDIDTSAAAGASVYLIEREFKFIKSMIKERPALSSLPGSNARGPSPPFVVCSKQQPLDNNDSSVMAVSCTS